MRACFLVKSSALLRENSEQRTVTIGNKADKRVLRVTVGVQSCMQSHSSHVHLDVSEQESCASLPLFESVFLRLTVLPPAGWHPAQLMPNLPEGPVTASAVCAFTAR